MILDGTTGLHMNRLYYARLTRDTSLVLELALMSFSPYSLFFHEVVDKNVLILRVVIVRQTRKTRTAKLSMLAIFNLSQSEIANYRVLQFLDVTQLYLFNLNACMFCHLHEALCEHFEQVSLTLLVIFDYFFVLFVVFYAHVLQFFFLFVNLSYLGRFGLGNVHQIFLINLPSDYHHLKKLRGHDPIIIILFLKCDFFQSAYL